MSKLKILTVPNPILNQVSQPVEKINSYIEKLINNMIDTVSSQTQVEAVGLAAPQIGKLYRIFIGQYEGDKKIQVYINPKILEKQEYTEQEFQKQLKKDENALLEGCLSIPGIYSPLKRAKKVLMEYLDLKGNKKKEWATGIKSINFQHEIDHLDGILFTQRALEQATPLYKEVNGKLKEINY